MSKYTMGAKITRIEDLVEICVRQRKSVYFMFKVVNCYFVENQQLRWLTMWVDRGVFHQAILKEKESKQNVDEKN